MLSNMLHLLTPSYTNADTVNTILMIHSCVLHHLRPSLIRLDKPHKPTNCMMLQVWYKLQPQDSPNTATWGCDNLLVNCHHSKPLQTEQHKKIMRS